MKQQDAVSMGLLKVAIQKTIDDVEMGVLEDGTAFVSGRSLAKLCGVAPSAIFAQADNWNAGKRDGKLAKKLTEAGIKSLYVPIPNPTGGNILHAYTADVSTVFLDYYAFDAVGYPEAVRNYRALVAHGLREAIYAKVGYKPRDIWKHFHDRTRLNQVPIGYFSVFHEMSKWVVLAIQGGLIFDHRNIPDISIGTTWSKEWKRENYEEIHGKRRRHPHEYPPDYPQSAANGAIDPWIYPLSALGDFWIWMQQEYVPNCFPRYLGGKVDAATAKKILAAVAPKELFP